MPFVLSLISHKEVRFIYPLLPALHILAVQPLVRFFYPALNTRSSRHTPQRLTLLFLIVINVFIALYTTIWHASGVLNVLTYLRHQHEIHTAEPNHIPLPPSLGTAPEQGITAGFLMPCHSTPWRSHLIHPTINAWALSCEPPVDFTPEQKAHYLDEADQFYDSPAQYLRKNMAGGLRHFPRRPSYVSGARSLPTTAPRTSSSSAEYLHEWPDYLIFFAALEPTLHTLLRSSSYGECWRTWNTAWHDDWRRKGDIVVWCLDSGEQDAWRTEKRRLARATRDKKFDKLVEKIKKEARRQQNRDWFSLLSPRASLPWSSPMSSVTRFRRSVQSSYSRLWSSQARGDGVWTKAGNLFGRQSHGIRDWIPALPSKLSMPSWPSLPGWLGGKLNKTKKVLDRELWS